MRMVVQSTDPGNLSVSTPSLAGHMSSGRFLSLKPSFLACEMVEVITSILQSCCADENKWYNG